MFVHEDLLSNSFSALFYTFSVVTFYCVRFRIRVCYGRYALHRPILFLLFWMYLWCSVNLVISCLLVCPVYLTMNGTFCMFIYRFRLYGICLVFLAGFVTC